MGDYPKQKFTTSSNLTTIHGASVAHAAHYSAPQKERKNITSVLASASKDVLASKEVKAAKGFLTSSKPKEHLSEACKTASDFLDTASKHIGGAQPTIINGQPVDPKIIKIFKGVNTDISGKLTAPKLQKALNGALLIEFGSESCEKLIAMYDQSCSGSLNINEFQKLFEMVCVWKGIFEAHDIDKSGDLDEHELQIAFQQLKHNLSPVFVSSLLKKYNPSTKKITLEQFIFICFEVKRLSERFRARDTNLSGQVTMRHEEFIGIAMGVYL